MANKLVLSLGLLIFPLVNYCTLEAFASCYNIYLVVAQLTMRDRWTLKGGIEIPVDRCYKTKTNESTCVGLAHPPSALLWRSTISAASATLAAMVAASVAKRCLCRQWDGEGAPVLGELRSSDLNYASADRVVIMVADWMQSIIIQNALRRSYIRSKYSSYIRSKYSSHLCRDAEICSVLVHCHLLSLQQSEWADECFSVSLKAELYYDI